MGASESKPKSSNPWEELDKLEGKLDKYEKAHGYYVSPNDPRIASGVETGRIAAMHAKQDQVKAQSNYNALKARLDALKYGASPKRRVSSRSTTKTRSMYAKTKVSKIRKTHKNKIMKRGPRKVSATKTRSQYATSKSKKVLKSKGMKNYLSRVVSNVTDSVKNTGKAVLSPLRMKRVKKTRKVSKA